MRIRTAVAIAALAFALDANALTALEFLKMETDGKEAPVCKQLVLDFVGQGYRKVPDWSALSVRMRKVILDKGYTTVPVEQVALEAALGAGMTR